MKLVFLDVDGVLNHLDYFKEVVGKRGRAGLVTEIDPVCVKRLHRLLDTTGAEVVLSSTWRLHPELYSKVEESIGQKIRYATPQLPGPRGREIEAFLNQNEWWMSPYVILDDDRDMLRHQLDHFVNTSFEDGGLLDHHVDQAIKILTEVV